MYIVFKLPIFDKKAKKKLNNKEFKELNNFIEILKKNPKIGKPLSYQFLREKKIKNKRIFFLLYKEIYIVLLVSISNKKSQQKTINEIKFYLNEYR
jgi:hypothetical protein